MTTESELDEAAERIRQIQSGEKGITDIYGTVDPSGKWDADSDLVCNAYPPLKQQRDALLAACREAADKIHHEGFAGDALRILWDVIELTEVGTGD